MPNLILPTGVERGTSYAGGYERGIVTGANGVPWVFMGGPGSSQDEAPPAQPRDIRRMLVQDGKALQVCEALTLPLRAAEDKVTGDQAQWTRDWMARLDPPWEVVMGQLAGASMFSRTLFEIVWGVGPDGRVCPVRIAFRPLDNTSVVLDEHGQPESLEQSFDGRTVPIDRDHSLIYLHNQHRAPGVGISDIGPVWQAHWEKKAIRSLWRIFLRRAAMPWLKASKQDATTANELQSFARTVATVQSGGVIGIGASEDVAPLDAGGQAGAVFEMALHWCDSQMSQSVMAQFLDLGQAKVGSFALSKDHSDFFAQGRDGVLKAIAGDFTRQVVRKALKVGWGERADGALTFGSLTEGNPDQLATLLQQIAVAPVINPAIPAEFVRALILGVSKNLGLDVESIRKTLDTSGSPDAQMASAAQGAVHVLRAAMPVAA